MIKITVEELDIVVQASVEQALTEFKKIVPQLKKTIKQVESNLSNIETKGMISKVQQGIQQVKQKISEVKNTSVDKQLQSQFDKAGASVEKYQGQLEEAKQKLRQVYVEMDNIQANTWKQYTPEGVELGNKAIEPTVNNDLADNKQYQSLSREATKLEQQIASLSSKLNTTKQQYGQIAEQIQQIYTKQSVWSRAVEKVKNTFSSLGNVTSKIKGTFNQLPKITSKISTKITQMGIGLKQGLGHILRYAGALFSLQTIYSALSSSANAWLSSQNQAAKQLNANIEYMQYAMGSALAPIIQFVTNLVYKLMKAIQSVAYALTGVNIFANASADAYSNMASNASDANKATKQLAGVHSEINNISSNDSSSSSGGGENMTPSLDLSKVDTSIIGWIGKIKERLSTLFEPIKNSWDTYGQALMDSIKYAFNSNLELIKTIGKSFEEVWLNGTGEHTCNTILQILTSIFNTCGNINKAFKEAWENNGGTDIIQNLWNGLNNIFGIIQGIAKVFENWTSSESFQAFADSIISIFNTLSSWFEIITQKLKEIWDNGGEETFTNLLNFISKLVEAVKVFIDFLSPIIEFAVELVGGAIGTIIQVIGDIINSISGLIDFIIGIFTGDWERAWNGIKEFFSGIWNGIRDLASGIAEQIWTYIKTWLDNFKQSWSDAWNVVKNVAVNIWNGLKSAVTNVFNGIWNIIRGVINSILGGIEGMANGVVNGVNVIVKALNNLKFDIPDWIPGLGGKTFGFNIPQLSKVSLPRLAKGAVLRVPTIAEMAEYPGASTNPEIVTPQNIMEETFDRVMSRYQDNNSSRNEGIKQLVIQFGSHKVAVEMESLIRQAHRRNGTASITI